MIEEDPFNLNKLVLPREMIRERCITVPRKIRHGHFVKVPWAWIERLAPTHSAATYRVAHHVLYQHWKQRGQPIRVANGVLRMEGVPRTSKWRALLELERLGLISIERRLRKSPLVTVHLHPQS
jgi:hypothetical protein